MANYQKLSDGKIYTESVNGSQKWDVVSSLPPNAVLKPQGMRIGRAWSPSPNRRQINYPSFNSGAYKMCLNGITSNLTHAQWQAIGFQKISNFQSFGSNDFNSLPSEAKFFYFPESALHGNKEGAGFYESSLAEMEAQYHGVIPSLGPGAHICFNIESSNDWVRSFYHDGPTKFYPAWSTVKDKPILCEFDGVTRTIEQLFNDPNNLWLYEGQIRYANRVFLAMKIARERCEFAAYGASITQGEPRTNRLNPDYHNRFKDSGARFDRIPGWQGNDTLVLNERTYMGMDGGSFYKLETFHLDYHYYGDPGIQGGSYQHITADQGYPALWPLLINKHVFARELGHRLANDKQHRDVHGGETVPNVRMTQPYYESGFRTPASWGCRNAYEENKLDQPPYLNRTMVLVDQFYSGQRRGSGFYVFTNYLDSDNSNGFHGNGVIDVNELANLPEYNTHQHSIESFAAAMGEMEGSLDFLANSVLTTDLDIRYGGTGNWDNINAVRAYGMGPDGEPFPILPCGMTRHRVVSGGMYVQIMCGADLDLNTTRTDHFRIPGVMATNVLSVTYKGPGAHLFGVYIPAGYTNTTFQCKSLISAWERKGYGGIIN